MLTTELWLKTLTKKLSGCILPLICSRFLLETFNAKCEDEKRKDETVCVHIERQSICEEGGGWCQTCD